jgi:hypothetical protein
MTSLFNPLRPLAPTAAAAAAALALASVGSATTAPGARVYIPVTVNGPTLLIGAGASAARGEWIVFHIANRGTKSVKVSFDGHTSAPIAAHTRGALALLVIRRGVYQLVLTDGTRRVRRAFVVY